MEKEKKCFKCSITKPLSMFYAHPQMGDGHLNKCIECTKMDSRKRFDEKIKEPLFVESERARGRKKYHRYKYKSSATKETRIKWENRFPEKLKAAAASQYIKVEDGLQKHHWSYNQEHWKDIIPLNVRNHKKAHRFIQYDQEQMMYRTIEGVLLDTKERHMEYITIMIQTQQD